MLLDLLPTPRVSSTQGRTRMPDPDSQYKGGFRGGARGAEAPPLQVYSTPVQSFAALGTGNYKSRSSAWRRWKRGAWKLE